MPEIQASHATGRHGAGQPTIGVVMGFDFGEKLIGVAIGNTLTASARALQSVRAERREAKFEAIARLIAQWEPVQLVVGLPLSREGEEQLRSTQARRFANQLHGRFKLPVALVDERYTSRAAEDAGAADVDAESARLILEQYLHTHH
ncbi:MAG: Holliday junction resolvase RuvX [Thiomonas sp. 13-66-29]|jgi:putative Holliday junction resolvase|uniref:Putative pre-16S rRNA nuclease n=1 Tax=Thiomonas delicata TaxID=364030 RepID=A0A238D693_THIDL|nr:MULTISPECIES: Holliday junction resolvase RuvX [Thiomonas]OZB44451.1 MAG: Holliday junction resolvase RuvX [Thiomonas sp. 15-66-11]OZB65858.1 MAG: Holliday junction resolvase RuvX [Thiomonas sp. 13-66-29]SBP88684.1 Holliday junction resolvase [Thiomonas delicata]